MTDDLELLIEVWEGWEEKHLYPLLEGMTDEARLELLVVHHFRDRVKGAVHVLAALKEMNKN